MCFGASLTSSVNYAFCVFCSIWFGWLWFHLFYMLHVLWQILEILNSFLICCFVLFFCLFEYVFLSCSSLGSWTVWANSMVLLILTVTKSFLSEVRLGGLGESKLQWQWWWCHLKKQDRLRLLNRYTEQNNVLCFQTEEMIKERKVCWRNKMKLGDKMNENP